MSYFLKFINAVLLFTLCACGGGSSTAAPVYALNYEQTLRLGMTSSEFSTLFNQPVFKDGSSGLGDLSPTKPKSDFLIDESTKLSPSLSFKNDALYTVYATFDYQLFETVKNALTQRLAITIHCEEKIASNLKVAPIKYSACVGLSDQVLIEVSERQDTKPFDGFFKVSFL